MALQFEKYDAEHQRLWDSMKIIRDQGTLHRVAEKIKKHQSVYEAVQKDTGVPWQMVAVIHLREAGEQDIGVWKGVLHNGEKIVGTGRKTRLVPAGRGPFSSWHTAAVDALKMKRFHLVKGWTPAKMLSGLEPFNGYGYRNKGLRSPYLWASTNHQQRGKYVRDGVFDGSVMDTQVGCAAQLKFLGVGNKLATGPIIAVGGGAAAVTAVTSAPEKYVPWILVGIAAVSIAAGIYLYFRNRKAKQNVS